MVLLTKLKIKCSGRNLAGVKRLSEHLLMMLIKALDFFFLLVEEGLTIVKMTLNHYTTSAVKEKMIAFILFCPELVYCISVVVTCLEFL